MKKMRFLALIMVASIVMSACGKSKETPAPEPVAEDTTAATEEEKTEEVVETVEEETEKVKVSLTDEERMVLLDLKDYSPERVFPAGSYVCWDTFYDPDGNVLVEPEAGRDAIMLSNEDTVYLMYYDNLDSFVESEIELYDTSGNLLWTYENETGYAVMLYNSSAETGWVEMEMTDDNGTIRKIIDITTDEVLFEYCCADSFFDTGLIYFISDDENYVSAYDPYAKKVEDIIDISEIGYAYCRVVSDGNAVVLDTVDDNFENQILYIFDIDGNYYGGVKIPNERYNNLGVRDWKLADFLDDEAYSIDDLNGEVRALDDLKMIAKCKDNENIIVCGGFRLGFSDTDTLKYCDDDGNVMYECSKGTSFANGIAFVVKDGDVLAINENFETIVVLDEDVDLGVVDVLNGIYEEDILIYRSEDGDAYYRILPREE